MVEHVLEVADWKEQLPVIVTRQSNYDCFNWLPEQADQRKQLYCWGSSACRLKLDSSVWD